METCYKVFRTSILSEIKLKSDRFGFEPEITAKVSKKKVPICRNPYQLSRTALHRREKIGWKDGVAAIGHIIHYRFFD